LPNDGIIKNHGILSISGIGYGYRRLAALYRWIVSHACDGESPPCSFIVVEIDAPLFHCRVMDLDDEFLAIGWREAITALEAIGLRTAANDWSDHRNPEFFDRQSEC
jgi:hypothetical protein